MDKKTAQNLKEKVKSDFDKIAKDFDKTRQSDWSEFSLYLPSIKDGQVIADLGCGNGRFYDFLKKNKQDISYIGIDQSKEMIEIARNTHKEDTSEKAVFLEADIVTPPLPKESIDVVCAIASFHHIPSTRLRRQSLQEIKNILKPGGIFIISVWNLFQPKYKKYLRKAFWKWLRSFGCYDRKDTFIPWSDSGVNRYYYAFRSKELKEILNKAGFKILEKHEGNNLIFICQKND